MPKINRRRFMQVASATVLASLLPAMPASATPVSRGANTAQMLWSSLHSKARNAQDFGSITRSMGISERASRGIYAKLSHA